MHGFMLTIFKGRLVYLLYIPKLAEVFVSV